jgi:peptide/nickel transport system permease protein
LLIAVAVTALATLLGLWAGYLGGWTDAVVGRTSDVVYSLPGLLVAIVVVGVLGGGYFLGIVVLIVLGLPVAIRSKRAAVLAQRGLPYVEAARVLGLPRRRILLREVLPNIAPVIIASFFLNFTYAFVDLSTLSFLGLGVDPGTPDWGRMMAESRVLIFDNPAAAIAPLVLIVLTAVSANLVGEDLAERLAMRGRSR